MTTKQLKKEELTDEQRGQVKERATEICLTILSKGNSFVSYGDDYHFWWDGPRFEDPRNAPCGTSLADFDDLQDIEISLYRKGYISSSERRLWNVIAEEVRNVAHKYSQEMPHDTAVDEDITKTRGKQLKRTTVRIYLWDRLHYYKNDYEETKGNKK